MNANYLFRKGSLSDVLHAVEAQAVKEVAGLPTKELESHEVAELAESLLTRLLPRPPVLRLDAQYARPPREVELEIEDYGLTLKKPGTLVTIVMPFDGNGELFQYEPSSYASIAPQGIVELEFLYLKYQFTQGSNYDLSGAIDRDIDLIQRYLAWIRTDVENFAGHLRLLIRNALTQRREHLYKISRSLQDLGIPVRTEAEASAAVAVRTATHEGQYHAFISYASEDRDFVDPLARTLASSGLRIWFDQFELAVGDSLRKSIDRGLTVSRYGIVVLSKSFFAKEWPQYELSGLLAREMDGRKVILPVWRDLSREDVLAFSPSLADKLALASPPLDAATVANRLGEVLQT
jgi:hypothetical protein